MPLSNDKTFGVSGLTEAINLLPANPTIIRELGIFKPQFLTTTYAEIELKENGLSLVQTKPRGSGGQPTGKPKRYTRKFDMLHLPEDDIVRADDVQNLRGFGSKTQAQALAEHINEKLGNMKSDIEYTREHLMLGALLGMILDADGSQLFDIYQEFGLSRAVFNWDLSTANTEVGKKIDNTLTVLGQKHKGESVSGQVALCSPEFMQEFVYHKNIKSLYERFQAGQVYREGKTNVRFKHKNITFIQYDHQFGSGEKIPAGEAILAPLGTRKTFRECFAPADMNSTVNTLARAYYASREKLAHDKGWSLHAQSNPLPMVMRPELVATIKIG